MCARKARSADGDLHATFLTSAVPIFKCDSQFFNVVEFLTAFSGSSPATAGVFLFPTRQQLMVTTGR
jgi:uncharacterized membrane protein YgaE (UPF0421/DUF939 family)